MRLILFSEYDKVDAWFFSSGMTFIMWIVAITEFQWKNIVKFRSSKPDTDEVITSNNTLRPKKAKEFSNNDILYYVRLTIYESILNEQKMIFDSSDYEIINNLLGTFNDFQPELKTGNFINVFWRRF